MIKKTFYLFFVGALAFSCKKEEPTPTTPTPVTPAEDNFFISGKVDGTLWYAENGKNGCQHGAAWSASLDSDNNLITIDYNGVIDQNSMAGPITSPLNGLLVVNMSHFVYNWENYTDSDDLFNGTFTTGSKSFYLEGTSGSGAEIEYYDANDQRWSTRFGSQSGSTFNFSSIVNSNINAGKDKLCKGTYSCKLYKETDPTQFKTVTSGSFYVLFEKY